MLLQERIAGTTAALCPGDGRWVHSFFEGDSTSVFACVPNLYEANESDIAEASGIFVDSLGMAMRTLAGVG